MSADELRRAATTLRERANAATPGKWIGFGQAIGVTVKGCTCAGPVPGYPQHESYCGTDGPIVDATEPDIAYIATVQPDLGLALADWLESEVREAEWREGQAEHMNADRVRPEPFPVYYDRTTEKAIAVARLILGGAS